ncbi:MAG: restriction endonuclease subunit S [Cellvibrionaceae bacterium]|nr:restriction endonuclease subunit S [Cellvibrionaceae bacterium]
MADVQNLQQLAYEARNDSSGNLDGVPETWLVTTLEDVLLRIVGGGTPSKGNPEFYSGKIPWMTVKDMNKHILQDTVDHISEEAVKNSSTNVIPAGTPIIATRMSLGKIVVANFDSAINQDLKALFAGKGVSKDFLMYWYRSCAANIEALGTGTTVKGIRLEVLKTLAFPLCPPAEQKAIAQKLDTLLAQVDNIKQRLDSIPAILKTFRQSVLAAAVSGRLTEEWREENECNEVDGDIKEILEARSKLVSKRTMIPEKHLEGDEYEIPTTWKWVSLDSLASKIVDGVHHKPEYVDEGVPFMSVKDINDGKLSFNHCKYISEETHKEIHPRCNPEKGDLLITKSGTIGRTAIVDTDEIFDLFVSVALIKPASNKVNMNYIDIALCQWVNSIDISSRVVGTAIKNLHLRDMRVLAIPFAPIEEQTQIVQRVEELFAFADQIKQQVKNAQSRVNNLTQSILAKAFRGELTEQWRIDNPELITGENSAEALLKKIQQEREKLKPAKKTRAKKALTNKKDTPVTADATDVAAIQVQPKIVATPLPEDDIEWALTIREACGKNTSLLAQDELSRLIADHLGLKRLTEQRKEAIKKAAAKACKTHLLYKEGGQYGLYQPRFADYENDSLDLVIQKAARKGRWVEQEELYRACLNYLGFKRSSDLAMERFKSYVNSALRRKILERDGSLLKRV